MSNKNRDKRTLQNKIADRLKLHEQSIGTPHPYDDEEDHRRRDERNETAYEILLLVTDAGYTLAPTARQMETAATELKHKLAVSIERYKRAIDNAHTVFAESLDEQQGD